MFPPCGLIARTLEEALELAETRHSKQEIRDYIHENFGLMDWACDEIRPTYRYERTCQKAVLDPSLRFWNPKAARMYQEGNLPGRRYGYHGCDHRFCYLDRYRCQAGDNLPEDMQRLQELAMVILPEELTQTVEEFDRMCKGALKKINGSGKPLWKTQDPLWKCKMNYRNHLTE